MKKKGKFGLKGRGVEPKARAEIRALLAGVPRRPDLLIEFLHRIQDRYGHISAAHVAALAEAMKLSQTEVYEVATFYVIFQILKAISVHYYYFYA